MEVRKIYNALTRHYGVLCQYYITEGDRVMVITADVDGQMRIEIRPAISTSDTIFDTQRLWEMASPSNFLDLYVITGLTKEQVRERFAEDRPEAQYMLWASHALEDL